MWQKQGLVGPQRNQRDCQCQLQAKHSQAHQGWFGKSLLLLTYLNMSKSISLPFKRPYSFELYYLTENWHLKLYFISSLFSIVNIFVAKWNIRSFLLIFFPFHNFRSSKSPLPSTPVPGFVRTPKPAGKAVTLATVNARVPRMPVCLKKNCG